MANFRRLYCAFVLSWMALPLATGATLYRCTAEDGAIEFRQQACATGIEERLEVKDVKVGWRPPEIKTEKKKKPAAKKTRKRLESRKKQQRKSDRACWNKRQQLERVEWRLKRGYKAGKGNELRFKRRQYEDYLDKFC